LVYVVVADAAYIDVAACDIVCTSGANLDHFCNTVGSWGGSTMCGQWGWLAVEEILGDVSVVHVAHAPLCNYSGMRRERSAHESGPDLPQRAMVQDG